MTPETSDDPIEAAAQLAAGEPTHEGHYRNWPWWGNGNWGNDSEIVKFCDALAAQIRALRRPDAAPAPEKRCECFGDTGMHASAHEVDGRECCDLCGWPIADGTTEAAAAARPVPQAGDVTNIIADLKREASYWDGEADTYQVLRQAADLLTAQAAALAAKDAAHDNVIDVSRRTMADLLKAETRIAELETALRKIDDVSSDPLHSNAQSVTETLIIARAALAPAGKAAPRTAPKPASEMSDTELQNDFTDHCRCWDKAIADRDGHCGSPGEWIVERLDELRTEAKRRGLALVEPPPAGKEPEQP